MQSAAVNVTLPEHVYFVVPENVYIVWQFIDSHGCYAVSQILSYSEISILFAE